MESGLSFLVRFSHPLLIADAGFLQHGQFADYTSLAVDYADKLHFLYYFDNEDALKYAQPR